MLFFNNLYFKWSLLMVSKIFLKSIKAKYIFVLFDLAYLWKSEFSIKILSSVLLSFMKPLCCGAHFLYLPPRGGYVFVTVCLSVSVCPCVRPVCPSVCLSVRVSVCVQDNSKTTGRIFLKFGRHVGIVKSKRWHDFGDDPEWTIESGSVIPNLHIFNVPYFKA